MDKSYHVNRLLVHPRLHSRAAAKKRRWNDKPPEYEAALFGNRRRT